MICKRLRSNVKKVLAAFTTFMLDPKMSLIFSERKKKEKGAVKFVSPLQYQ